MALRSERPPLTSFQATMATTLQIAVDCLLRCLVQHDRHHPGLTKNQRRDAVFIPIHPPQRFRIGSSPPIFTERKGVKCELIHQNWGLAEHIPNR